MTRLKRKTDLRHKEKLYVLQGGVISDVSAVRVFFEICIAEGEKWLGTLKIFFSRCRVHLPSFVILLMSVCSPRGLWRSFLSVHEHIVFSAS